MLPNKVILVTGGSRGIGANIVQELSKQGYTVIMNYNKSEEQANKIKNELGNNGIHIDIVKADISKRNEVKNLINFIIEKYEHIDDVINNAGISQIKLFTEITDEDWNKMLQTNLTSAFYVTQEAVPSMIQQKSGCIINISSVWGIVGASCEVHYSVAKAGLDGMTKALAKELGPSNINVNCVCPGLIDTDMNSELSEEDKQQIIEETPMNRIGTPSDVANAIYFLSSENATFVTGQTLTVDGGWIN